MLQIQYIIVLIIILIAFYFIFFKKDTFINRKLENFEGDDLNIHTDGEYNINTIDSSGHNNDIHADIIE